MKTINYNLNNETIFSLCLFSLRDILDLIFYSNYDDSIMNEMIKNPLFYGGPLHSEMRIVKNMSPLRLRLFKAALFRRGAQKIYIENKDRFLQEKSKM